MINIREIADNADMIINGYAFTKHEYGYRVLNLHHPRKAAVFSKDGEALETTMDDIELSIAGTYLKNNRKYMED